MQISGRAEPLSPNLAQALVKSLNLKNFANSRQPTAPAPKPGKMIVTMRTFHPSLSILRGLSEPIKDELPRTTILARVFTFNETNVASNIHPYIRGNNSLISLFHTWPCFKRHDNQRTLIASIR